MFSYPIIFRTSARHKLTKFDCQGVALSSLSQCNRGKNNAMTSISFSFDIKRSDRKVWQENNNKNKQAHCEGNKRAIKKEEKISKINVYYHIMYQ